MCPTSTITNSDDGHASSGPSCRVWRLPVLQVSTGTFFLLFLVLTLLLLQCSPACASTQEIRSPGGKPHKFMRWGKRFFNSQDLNSKTSSDDSKAAVLQEELVIPVFGTDRILCKHVAAGGLYKCISYRSSDSTPTHQGEQ